MAPFEALYGKPCLSPICWVETEERAILGPDYVKEITEKIGLIRKRIAAAQRNLQRGRESKWNMKWETLFSSRFHL